MFISSTAPGSNHIPYFCKKVCGGTFFPSGVRWAFCFGSPGPPWPRTSV